MTTAPWGIKTIPQSTTTSGGFNPNSTFAESTTGDNAYVPMRVRLEKLSKDERIAQAKRLNSIGKKVPLSGRITEDFIRAAQEVEDTARNAAAESGVAFTPEYYLNWFKNEAAGEAESSNTQSYDPYAQKEFSIEFTPGLLLLFPSYLHHSVPLNKTEKTRCSLAFNVVPTVGFGEETSLTELKF